MLEKHVWICAFMLVGATHGCTVGEVESDHAAAGAMTIPRRALEWMPKPV